VLRSLSALLSYALIVPFLIPGCSGPPDNPPAPAISGPASTPAVEPSADEPTADEPSADEPSADGPPGAIACGKAALAVRDATLMNPGVITDITRASGTADAPVADAAQHLSEAYTEAAGAHGTGAEPDAVAAVSAAAAELLRICSDSGLVAVG